MSLIPIYAWTRGVRNFQHRRNAFAKLPWAQGGVLLACVVVAMLLANLPLTKDIYHNILETSIGFNIDTPSGDSIVFPVNMTVEKFINDILMVIFFFVVGLEIKREVMYGELSSPKKAVMPIIAAFGGVMVPAFIYFFINRGTDAVSGWGIPTATDIAFAVGILSMLGNKVPVSLKVFLTALAIADDLIAILVVALFYGGAINLKLLLIAFVLIGIIILFNKLGEKRLSFYIILGLCIWTLFYYSGIHATMSGVVMAFLVPAKARYSRSYLEIKTRKYRNRLKVYDAIEDPTGFPNGPQRHCLRRITATAKDSMGMSFRLEHLLGPWVNFMIMPIFALANAGVEITDPSFFNVFQYSPELGSVSMGVFLGLLLGKPVGITLASFLAVKTKLGAMPHNATWAKLFAVSCLGGIGFTMSIFVDTLSFGDYPDLAPTLRDMGKIAVLLGSLCAGIAGTILITIVNKLQKAPSEPIQGADVTDLDDIRDIVANED